MRKTLFIGWLTLSVLAGRPCLAAEEFVFGQKDQKVVESLFKIENIFLRYEINVAKRSVTVLDKKTNRRWQAFGLLPGYQVTDVKAAGELKLTLKAQHARMPQEFTVEITLAPDLAQVSYVISQKAEKGFTELEFPPMFTLDDRIEYVVPLQEGLLLPRDFPVKDFPWRLRYGGAWSMAFIGAVEGESGWMQFVETPLDFELRRDEDENGKLMLRNVWIPQQEAFGYERRLRHIFFDQGGYMVMAKWYRQFARERGVLVTLKEKEAAGKKQLAKLFGAVAIRYGGDEPKDLMIELAKTGIQRAMFCGLQNRRDVLRANKLEYLSGVDSNFQDIWLPNYQGVIEGTRHNVNDIVMNRQGQWLRWARVQKGEDRLPGGVICSTRSLAAARSELAAESKVRPAGAKFIASLTAAPFFECYNPLHPLSRSQDVKNKMDILRLASGDQGYVTGCEDGVDCAVPSCDYFEGMLSVRLGRLPAAESGAAPAAPQVTADFQAYGVGETYRVPLWELAFGDGAVSTWHADDASNVVPELWWRKDLINILYGTMPLWSVPDLDYWQQYRERFLRSYQLVTPVLRRIADREMLSHRFLTRDRSIQETTFAGDITAVVNFSDQGYVLRDRQCTVPARGFVVFDGDSVLKTGVCDGDREKTPQQNPEENKQINP